MLYATRLPATDEAGPPQIETALPHQANCIPPTPMSNKERSSLFTEIHNLREERDALKDRLVQAQSHKLCTNVIEDDDEKSRFYTGFTWAVFLQTFIFINDGLRPANVGSMCYMKLRQNPRFQYLADHVGIGKSTVIDIFWKWVGVINSKLHCILCWPERDNIFEATPAAFKSRS
ncbi:hypothetical protein MAR_001777 [Mya arenaria]|uniref:Transposase Helix-turn-helix domain-containing protein n=1 Tax=Mya arenaria TaxID=6604 RepID=A0ABY7FGE4_MYAAR|nr:hypothetical protein MAR_001777 [Mya arenaria]